MCIILYLHSIFLRELGSLNFFKQKVVAHWPDDWTASNTKVGKGTGFRGAIKKIHYWLKCLSRVLFRNENVGKRKNVFNSLLIQKLKIFIKKILLSVERAGLESIHVCFLMASLTISFSRLWVMGDYFIILSRKFAVRYKK